MVKNIECLYLNNENISSTEIRKMIRENDLEKGTDDGKNEKKEDKKDETKTGDDLEDERLKDAGGNNEDDEDEDAAKKKGKFADVGDD